MKKIIYAFSGIQLMLLMFLSVGTFGGDQSYILFSHPTGDEPGKIEAVGELKDSLDLTMNRENWAMVDGEIMPVDKYTLEIKTASGYPVKLYFGRDKKLAYQYRKTIEKGDVVLDISGCLRDHWDKVKVFDTWRKIPLHPDIETKSASGGKDVYRVTQILKRRAYWVTDFDEDTFMIKLLFPADLDWDQFHQNYKAVHDPWNFMTEEAE